MQRLSVILLCILVSANAVAGARLPVVDVADKSVSARAVFGEEIILPNKVSQEDSVKQVKKVAARKTPQKNIVSSSDVLTPNKPSSDLWVNNETPLRMPRNDEFVVINSEAMLPEEKIEIGTFTKTNVSEIDQQIARLNDLQRQADESIKSKPAIITTPIGEKNIKQEVASVNLRREIVPMNVSKKEASNHNTTEPYVAKVGSMSKMSPTELKKAFKKTYLSENKHLSTYAIDNKFDVASEMSTSIEGFTAQQDLSESGGVRPLEIKIKFRDADSALSRENYSLLSEYASIVVNKPTRAIQVAIPERSVQDNDARKLAARRLAIVEQVLRDTGVAEQRIIPVLSQRNEEGFVLRIISGEQYETLSEQKRNMFGDTVSTKSYKNMAW